jgi:predicted dehydrogenase
MIAALVDPDPARRSSAAERFPAGAAYDTIAELLVAGGVDGAIIAVPHHLHHELAAQALDAGLHTLIEKPMTIDPADAHDLVKRAERNGAELIVGYPWHYNGQAVQIREALSAGRIGEIEHVTGVFASTARDLYRGHPEQLEAALKYSVHAPDPGTYSDPVSSGGGQGQTQLTHSAALLLWLTGLRVSEVAGWTANFELDVDLANAVAVRFESGANGVLSSTGGVIPGHDELLEYRIFGREGHVAFDAGAGTASIHDRDGVERLPELAEADRYPQLAPTKNLVDVILGRATNRSPGRLGSQVVELVDAMYRSQRTGAAVTLTPALG